LLFSCERWGITALHVLVSTVGKKVKVRGLPHLAKNERDVGHPTILGRDKEKMGVAEELTGNERNRFHGRSVELQIPPLRFASVGMTRGGWDFSVESG
jgi:hypothetical protein